MADQQEATPAPPDDSDVADGGAEQFTQWEFIDRIPEADEVRSLLSTLPDVWGVSTVDFIDYVQGLPGRKKVVRKTEMPNGRFREEDEWHDTYTLYMSVAGRIKMLEAAAAQNGWQVEFEPEPITPTGAPGLLQLTTDDSGNGRIVYREYVVIRMPVGPVRLVGPDSERGTVEVREWMLLGRKPGMAWVPYRGGKQAAGSNPYEKVETAARGRAIAAWGFGVFPNSGLASVEEMMGVRDNERAQQREQQAAGQQARSGNRKSREELLEEALMLSEQVRQARGLTAEDQTQRLAKYLSDIGVVSAYDAEAGAIDWQRPRDGHLQLLVNSLGEAMREIRAQEAPL